MEKSEKFWDRTAKNYDREDDQYDESYLRTIKSYLGESDTVLDFACGTGTFSSLIASDVKEIRAIDISSKMLEIAERKAFDNNIENLNFLHATIFDQRLKNETFDVILTFNILHLLEDIPEMIQRINSLLKPGGIFISDTPCLGEKRNLVGIITALISKLPILPHVNNFSVAELKHSITNSNFQIVESEIVSPDIPTCLIVAKKI